MKLPIDTSSKTIPDENPKKLAIEGKRVEIDLLNNNTLELESRPKQDNVGLVSCMKRELKDDSFRPTKEVTFAKKLIVNEEELDKSMIERIKHNMEYNDDRIFEGLSIFELKSDEEENSKRQDEPNEAVTTPVNNEDSNERDLKGDSGNKDFTDVEQNQGILSI